MTALSKLLAGPAEEGIYRIPPTTDPATIERIAAAAGWRVVAFDTAGAVERAAVFAAMQEAFGFPDWFGHNLDALADSLRDVTHEPGTLVVWSGSESFAAADRAQFGKVLDVLRSRAANPTLPRLLTLVR